MLLLLLFVATLFLAYVNGANDNFKGVATLFGSQTVSYKTAIYWATFTTGIGSIVSVFLATALVKNFSGKGLVPDAIANASDFHLAVALGTGLTVLLATLTGFPISTTHGITGALVGAGLVAIGTQVNFSALSTSFILPLLLSPVIAVPSGMLLYFLLHRIRLQLGIKADDDLQTGRASLLDSSIFNGAGHETATIAAIADLPKIQPRRYIGQVLGVETQQLVNIGHFISAGIVSFARGLNDTPKIVPLILTIQAISLQGGVIVVAAGQLEGY